MSYADDNIPFAMGSGELEEINEIKSAAKSLTLLFQDNCVKVSPDKLHLLLSNKKLVRWKFVRRSSQLLAVINIWG